MSVGHYENFPVASWLMPAALRPAVRAIYRFARTADDIADEGDAAPAERLAALDALRAQLHAIESGAPSAWPDLATAVSEHQLALPLFHDLLSAFSQDVVTVRYDSFEMLLDYCRRSANPIGRLLLQLFRRGEDEASAAVRCDLQRLATRQLLAGHRARLAQGPRVFAAVGSDDIWRE